MQMRPSRVLKKLRAGQVATCFKLNLADARAAEIATLAGFDFNRYLEQANEQCMVVVQIEDLEPLEELITLDYRFISIGADVVGLAQYCSSVMRTFGAAPESADGQIYKA